MSDMRDVLDRVGAFALGVGVIALGLSLQALIVFALLKACG
jgi:hypothetical protein